MKLELEVLTKAQAALGGKVFTKYAERVDRVHYVDGVIDCVAVIEGSGPEDHSAFLLVNVLEPDMPINDTPPILAMIPLQTLARLGLQAKKALEDFDPKNQADA